MQGLSSTWLLALRRSNHFNKNYSILHAFYLKIKYNNISQLQNMLSLIALRYQSFPIS